MRRKAELAGGAVDPRNFSLTRQFPFENIIPGILVQKLIGKRGRGGEKSKKQEPRNDWWFEGNFV